MRKFHPHPNPPPQGGGNNRKALSAGESLSILCLNCDLFDFDDCHDFLSGNHGDQINQANRSSDIYAKNRKTLPRRAVAATLGMRTRMLTGVVASRLGRIMPPFPPQERSHEH